MEFIKKRLWMVLTGAACAAGVIAVALYIANGRTQFDPKYNMSLIVVLIAGIVLGAAAIALDFFRFARFQPVIVRALVFGQYLCGLYSVAAYVTSNLNLVGNLAYDAGAGSVDPPDPAVVATFMALIALTAVTMVFALAAGIIKKPAIEEEA